MRNCTTCVHSDKGKQFTCSKGAQAEVYCMGGDYDLWSDCENKPIVSTVGPNLPDIAQMARDKLDIVDKKVLKEAENIQSFDSPLTPYGQVDENMDPLESVNNLVGATIDSIEAELGRPLTEDEKREFESAKKQAEMLKQKLDSGEITPDDLKRVLSPEHLKKLEALKEAIQNMDTRPGSGNEGFNGIKYSDAGEVKSRTCEGCIHFSRVGCFLGKYYDCVDHGRYLYDRGKDVIASIEQVEEEVVSQKDVDFIDNLLLDENKE